MSNEHNIPKWVVREAVTDCRDATEFAHKYRKPQKFTDRGEEYVQAILDSHHKDIAVRGYTTISHHDNIMGKILAFIPNPNQVIPL